LQALDFLLFLKRANADENMFPMSAGDSSSPSSSPPPTLPSFSPSSSSDVQPGSLHSSSTINTALPEPPAGGFAIAFQKLLPTAMPGFVVAHDGAEAFAISLVNHLCEADATCSLLKSQYSRLNYVSMHPDLPLKASSWHVTYLLFYH